MQSRLVVFFAMLFLAVVASPLHAMGDKGKPASFSLHMETEASDNPKMIFPQAIGGATRYFRRLPDISTKDVAAFSPFPSEAGDGYGIVFKLKDNAARRYSALTNINQNRWMVATVNGRFVDGVIVDQQVNDGIVVIWKGVTLDDIAMLDKTLPRIGEPKGKKKP